jgi:hypothetical protein
MNLVDEEHVARLEIGEQRGEIAGALDHRPGGQAVADSHLAGDDLRQGRLAEAGRPREQHVVERLATRPRRGDEDAQILADLTLADEVIEAERAQRRFGNVVLAARAIDDARVGDGGGRGPIAHGASSLRPPRIRASRFASPPILREARATAPKASTRR